MAATQTFSAYWTGGLGVDEPIYFFFSLWKKFQDFFFFLPPVLLFLQMRWVFKLTRLFVSFLLGIRTWHDGQ